ncbi:MAG: hypothetical protein DI538_22455 [Azospira oryzae]|jgi:hypothetical protein|nr:hypothetical protein [Cytophaga sp.]PZR30540.1 MAG: hypothetical protein DI538_22455 [Azospira oryzae]
MSALIIVFSLLIGYVFFMMSFYLLAKVLFPKMEQSQEEEVFLAKTEMHKHVPARVKRSQSKSFGLSKQPQVA